MISHGANWGDGGLLCDPKEPVSTHQTQPCTVKLMQYHNQHTVCTYIIHTLNTFQSDEVFALYVCVPPVCADPQ